MPKKAEDLTGLTFREWRVIGRCTTIKGANALWHCVNINTGDTDIKPACTLKKLPTRPIRTSEKVPAIGTRINNWTVISVPFRYRGNRCIMLRCDCGEERMVYTQNLKRQGKRCIKCYNNRGVMNNEK